MQQPTCFVVMGFGKKTDFETGRVLDLDKSYHSMIKPAVEAAKLTCIRADDVVQSGLIDLPMYEQLLNADVVIADLSTSNKNAYYELGIRHALKPFTTIIIAEDGIKTFPFDINHIVVRQYHHLGEDIGFDEVMRFRELLTTAIKTIVAQAPVQKGDSPVYTFLKDLQPPTIADKVQAAIQDAAEEANKTRAVPVSVTPDQAATPTHSVLMAEVDAAQESKDWLKAKTLLELIRKMANDTAKQAREKATVEMTGEPQEDPYLLQRLALATYKSEFPTKKDALLAAQQLLFLLNPHTSNDAETLGLWGSVHKRLWEIDPQPQYLNEAIEATERGYVLVKDYYNGINYAFLLRLRAFHATDPDEANADLILARRVWRKVLDLCDQWLERNKMPEAGTVPEKTMKEYLTRWYWVMATKGEAYTGLGDESAAAPILKEAYEKAPEPRMRDSTEEQVGKLRELINNKPT